MTLYACTAQSEYTFLESANVLMQERQAPSLVDRRDRVLACLQLCKSQTRECPDSSQGCEQFTPLPLDALLQFLCLATAVVQERAVQASLQTW